MNEIGIIGASGFIGKNLCMHFHKENIDFVAIHRTKPKIDLPYNVLIKKSFTDLPEFKKLIFFPTKAAAIKYVPSSILSKIISWLTLLNLLMPLTSIFLLPIKLMLHPNFFKKKINQTSEHAKFSNTLPLLGIHK